jgi:hypothetical protein
MRSFYRLPLTCSVLFFTVLPQLVASETSSRPYDVLSYDWSVTLTFEKSPDPDSAWRSLFSPLNELQAEATISLRNVGAAHLNEIPLLFNRLLKPSAIEVAGQARPFQHELRGLEGNESLQINYVRVSLAQPLEPGAELEIFVRYGGQLMGYPESGSLYVRETLDPDFTILRSETYCYPRITRPTDEHAGWAARHDAFDQTLRVTVPVGHVAVNGGRSHGEQRKGNNITYTFASHEPDSAIQIPIAPYRSIETGGHRIFHFEKSEQGARRLAGQLDKAMVLLRSWFGPPPTKRGLTIAEIPEFFGSQAGALIIQTTGAFNDPEKFPELYHELTHIWNPPDVDDKPSRWNEGLATLLQAMVEARLSEQSHLDEYLGGIFVRLKKSFASDESLRGVAMKDYGEMDMTGFSYRTGALFFGLLREVVGEDEFLAFLARYSRDHQKTGSRDAEFAAAITAQLGEGAGMLVERFFLSSAHVDEILHAESWAELRDRYRSEN